MKQWFEEEDFWVNYAPIMFDDARWAEAPDVAKYVKSIANLKEGDSVLDAGCGLGRIRDLFLMEAGFIGLAGGAVGLLLSYGISAIINAVAGGSTGYSTLSYIPLWLSVVALVFAVIIGMLAGLLPALRAMKLSALSALRNE